LLRKGTSRDEVRELRERTRTGRPLGSPGFIKRLERKLERTLHRQKPGRKPMESKGK
jgi:hypothetical protein